MTYKYGLKNFMRHYHYIFLFLILLFSCNNEEDNTSNNTLCLYNHYYLNDDLKETCFTSVKSFCKLSFDDSVVFNYYNLKHEEVSSKSRDVKLVIYKQKNYLLIYNDCFEGPIYFGTKQKMCIYKKSKFYSVNNHKYEIKKYYCEFLIDKIFSDVFISDSLGLILYSPINSYNYDYIIKDSITYKLKNIIMSDKDFFFKDTTSYEYKRKILKRYKKYTWH